MIKICFLLIFLSFIKCLLYEGKIDFMIEKIGLPQLPCVANLGTYIFYIIGEFSSPPSVTKTININLETSSKNKLDSICYPLEKTEVSPSQFQCEINILSIIPIIRQKIYIQIDAPKTIEYNFPNWKEKIGSNPGISNKIPEDDIACLPKEINSFVTKGLINEGCSNGKNIITISGSWSDKSKLIIPSFFSLEMRLKNNLITHCVSVSENKIQCEYEGSGNFQIEEFFFKYGVNVYKIEKSELSLIINQCNSSFSRYINFNLALIMIILLYI